MNIRSLFLISLTTLPAMQLSGMLTDIQPRLLDKRQVDLLHTMYENDMPSESLCGLLNRCSLGGNTLNNYSYDFVDFLRQKGVNVVSDHKKSESEAQSTNDNALASVSLTRMRVVVNHIVPGNQSC